jgi:hypothetical protein
VANLLTNNAKNGMLDFLNAADFMSLHTGDPGTTGTNESTGGSPAYARKALTWSAASGGSKAISNSPVFDVPASTISYVGMWDSSTSGTYYGHWDVTDEVFAAQGTYTVTSGSVSLT